MGFRNAAFGAFPLYLSIPFLFIFHVFSIEIYLNRVVGGLAGGRRSSITNYILCGWDRSCGLPLIDRINCAYCAYANGLSSFYVERIDEIFHYEGNFSALQKLALICAYPIYIVPFKIYKAHCWLIYERLVFPAIGQKNISLKVAARQIDTRGQLLLPRNALLRTLLKEDALFAEIHRAGLAIIESFWCPIKHRAQPKISPSHQGDFVAAGDLEALRRRLDDGATEDAGPGALASQASPVASARRASLSCGNCDSNCA